MDIDADEIIATWPQERFDEAVRRTTAEFGGHVTDYEDEGFEQEFHRQLKLMAAEEVIDADTENGELEPVGLQEGHVKYGVTPLGQSLP